MRSSLAHCSNSFSCFISRCCVLKLKYRLRDDSVIVTLKRTFETYMMSIHDFLLI